MLWRWTETFSPVMMEFSGEKERDRREKVGNWGGGINEEKQAPCTLR